LQVKEEIGEKGEWASEGWPENLLLFLLERGRGIVEERRYSFRKGRSQDHRRFLGSHIIRGKKRWKRVLVEKGVTTNGGGPCYPLTSIKEGGTAGKGGEIRV